MKKIEVFDPPVCCASGACGPKVDKKIVDFSANLGWLRDQGVDVQRYNPTQQYAAFVGNPKVVQMVNDVGSQCLPIIVVDGVVVSHGRYPSRDELASLAVVNAGD